MDYNALKQRASAIIANNSDLVISYTTIDTEGYTKSYDPATNTEQWYYNGAESSEPTERTYTGTCVEVALSDYFMAKGFVKEKDTSFITSDIPAPSAGDTVYVGGVRYTVIRTRIIKPSSTNVLLKITARR